MERSSGFIVLLYGDGTDFHDVLGECIDFRSEFFRAVFAEPVLGCVVEIHGGIMRYLPKALRCHFGVQNMVHPDRLSDIGLLNSILDMFSRKTPDVFAAQIKALLERPDATPLLAE